ncbi:MAG: YwqI/YxiC family protein [Bacillus sp. (in: firmicutes)]
MSDEIKIRYSDVMQALSQLDTSLSAFQTTLPSAVGGNNVLNVVQTLNQLNETFQQINESYKSLLLSNKEATLHSIQSMQEADELLSSQMKILK